jgi:hypothetical protein
MKLKHTFKFLLLFLLTSISLLINAQTVPQGITYQGLARNSSGTIIANQAVSLKIGIYAPSVSGTLQWEETHTTSTNPLGVFYFIIGQGSSTGLGGVASFSLINWGAAPHVIKIAMDENGGNAFKNIDTIQFWTVPYAMYSNSSAGINKPLRLHQLLDVDTSGVKTGDVLKYNGTLWLPAADLHSDTALFALNSKHAKNADTSAYSKKSAVAVNATHATYSDTATYALNTASSFTSWSLTGNAGTNPTSNYIGTSDNVDVVLKTANTERMRITGAGNVGIGTAGGSNTTSPVSKFDVVVSDGNYTTISPTTGSNNALSAGIRILGQNGVVGRAVGIYNYNEGSVDNNHMLFYTNLGSTFSEKMRITSGGDVGIGTSSPGVKLDIVGTVRSIAGTPIFYLNNGTTQHSIQNNSGAFNLLISCQFF